MRITFKNRYGKLWFGVDLKAWINFKKTAEVTGITDACGTLPFRRVLFLEYDVKLNKKMLILELRGLQERFKLSEFYILESSKDCYHVYCVDKLTSWEIEQVVACSSSDEMFKKVAFYDYCPRVLRISEKGAKDKPKHIQTLHSKNQEREKSYAHLQALKFYFGIPKNELSYLNSDKAKIKGKEDVLELIRYPTAHNVT